MDTKSSSQADKDYELLVHELCNPLSIAKSLVEIMLKDPTVHKLDEVLINLKRIEVVAEKFKKLADDK